MHLTAQQRASFTGLAEVLTLEVLCVMISYFWYGVFMLLFLILTILHMRRKERIRAHNILFGAAAVGFILATTYVASRTAEILLTIDNSLVKELGVPLEALLSFVVGTLHDVDVVMSWAIFVPALIVDATIIWRVRALCQDNPWPVALACALWIGTFATTFSYVAWLSVPSGYEMATHPAPTVINNLVIAGVALSNVTNLVATSIFAWTLFRLRSMLKGRTPVQHLMALMIEYGSIYLILQLVYLAFLVSPPPDGTALRVFFYVVSVTYTSVSAMYPTAIIVLTKLSASSAIVMLASSKIADLNMPDALSADGTTPEHSYPALSHSEGERVRRLCRPSLVNPLSSVLEESH